MRHCKKECALCPLTSAASKSTFPKMALAFSERARILLKIAHIRSLPASERGGPGGLELPTNALGMAESSRPPNSLECVRMHASAPISTDERGPDMHRAMPRNADGGCESERGAARPVAELAGGAALSA